MIDIEDSKTLDFSSIDEYEEIFEVENELDPYSEYGVKRSDFAWYGCYNKT